MPTALLVLLALLFVVMLCGLGMLMTATAICENMDQTPPDSSPRIT